MWLPRGFEQDLGIRLSPGFGQGLGMWFPRGFEQGPGRWLPRGFEHGLGGWLLGNLNRIWEDDCLHDSNRICGRWLPPGFEQGLGRWLPPEFEQGLGRWLPRGFEQGLHERWLPLGDSNRVWVDGFTRYTNLKQMSQDLDFVTVVDVFAREDS